MNLIQAVKVLTSHSRKDNVKKFINICLSQPEVKMIQLKILFPLARTLQQLFFVFFQCIQKRVQ